MITGMKRPPEKGPPVMRTAGKPYTKRKVRDSMPPRVRVMSLMSSAGNRS